MVTLAIADGVMILLLFLAIGGIIGLIGLVINGGLALLVIVIKSFVERMQKKRSRHDRD